MLELHRQREHYMSLLINLYRCLSWATTNTRGSQHRHGSVSAVWGVNDDAFLHRKSSAFRPQGRGAEGSRQKAAGARTCCSLDSPCPEARPHAPGLGAGLSRAPGLCAGGVCCRRFPRSGPQGRRPRAPGLGAGLSRAPAGPPLHAPEGCLPESGRRRHVRDAGSPANRGLSRSHTSEAKSAH